MPRRPTRHLRHQLLLRLKSKSQYQVGSVSAADAMKSIDWAARLLETAESVMPS
jgi:hypothetical protein